MEQIKAILANTQSNYKDRQGDSDYLDVDEPEDKFLTIGSLQVTVQLDASRPCEGIERGMEVPPEEEFSHGYER